MVKLVIWLYIIIVPFGPEISCSLPAWKSIEDGPCIFTARRGAFGAYIHGKRWPWLIYCIKDLGCSCLAAAIQGYSVFRHPRQLFKHFSSHWFTCSTLSQADYTFFFFFFNFWLFVFHYSWNQPLCLNFWAWSKMINCYKVTLWFILQCYLKITWELYIYWC